ncbi:response regulator [Saccharomonospora viridis]|jgi:response regulator of citrate/malate metabolism|uniref:Transcriptional regulatory protein n=1 Tax=Saccharomonospora viridis (strain ATCC 15386 / DSM 43017 / JCM 3036 / CCUG 5913 / NBRC 12207 / NCIMB 9602 / P101) TaxID=471857 RepID=C7N027_SACVD|nr:response regulator [Saccharomonospora viridis]ACU97563.1 response regulator of citrate/malate metabolism [Saccharomonospora viridis DSM 43017]
MISVLVVEDDPVAAEAHREYVERVAGFTVAGVVHSGGAAVRFCERHHVDLVLLDFYLPDTHGLAVCRALRATGAPIDVIAVTSARDLAVVRGAVSAGVVQYLLKPFTFAALRGKLDSYARFRRSVARSGQAKGQADIDRLFEALRSPGREALPKGMSTATLDAVTAVLAESGDGLSAAAVAEATGVARVTARRYLEYLADHGIARRRPHYGTVGRPEVRYVPVGRSDGRDG